SAPRRRRRGLPAGRPRALGCRAAPRVRPADGSLSELRRRRSHVPELPVGQPPARVRDARGLLAALASRALGARLPARAVVQALLRVGHRQVAVAAPRLARRQRDALLLRDRAPPGAARLVRARAARLLARLRRLVHPLLRARPAVRDLRTAASPPRGG